MDSDAPRGMRPNYSCGSLAAAEQLGALMQQAHAPVHGGDPSAAQRQQQARHYAGRSAGGGAGLSALDAAASATGGLMHSVDPGGMHMPFGGGGGGCFDGGVDFGQGMPGMLNQSVAAAAYMGAAAAQLGGVGSNSLFSGGGVPSSFSMLHQYAAGVSGGLGGAGPNAMDSAETTQKRRFVWTSDLHQRFEAAVNALGLDQAKPKSILKLMNVENLTKANIKSHLQKYRCLMQKKAAAAGGSAPSTAGGATGASAGASVSAAGGDDDADPPLLECRPQSNGSAGSATCACADLSTVGGSSCSSALSGGGGALGAGGVGGGLAAPEQLLSEGECSLQRNLEVQEMTLKVQMELQEELSRQLQLQKRLQSEMETMMDTHLDTRAGDAYGGEGSEATSGKVSSILSLKRKLQQELQAHLRMQQQLLSQLNQVVLPAVERLHDGADGGEAAATGAQHSFDAPRLGGDCGDGSAKTEEGAAKHPDSSVHGSVSSSNLMMTGEEEEADDASDDDDDSSGPSKKPKTDTDGEGGSF